MLPAPPAPRLVRLRRVLAVEAVLGLGFGPVWIAIGESAAITASGIHFVIGGLLSILAMVRLRRGEGWGMAMAASMVWTLTILFPLGLYGIVTLSKRETRHAF